jgi:hypothetical protein
MKIGEDVVTRLKRTAAGDDPEMDDFAELFGRTIFASMPEPRALMLERHITFVAQAAEELGPDATAAEIARLATRLSAPPLSANVVCAGGHGDLCARRPIMCPNRFLGHRVCNRC